MHVHIHIHSCMEALTNIAEKETPCRIAKMLLHFQKKNSMQFSHKLFSFNSNAFHALFFRPVCKEKATSYGFFLFPLIFVVWFIFALSPVLDIQRTWWYTIEMRLFCYALFAFFSLSLLLSSFLRLFLLLLWYVVHSAGSFFPEVFDYPFSSH